MAFPVPFRVAMVQIHCEEREIRRDSFFFWMHLLTELLGFYRILKSIWIFFSAEIGFILLNLPRTKMKAKANFQPGLVNPNEEISRLLFFVLNLRKSGFFVLQNL